MLKDRLNASVPGETCHHLQSCNN